MTEPEASNPRHLGRRRFGRRLLEDAGRAEMQLVRIPSQVEVTIAAEETPSPSLAENRSAAKGYGGRMRVRADVVTISSDGCRLQLSGQLPEGALVRIKLPGRESLTGKIVWSRPGNAGCEFSHPLHPSVVRRLSTL